MSVTNAARMVGKLVLVDVVCGVPAAAVMLAAGPGRLVKLNDAGVLTPLTDAVTAKLPATVLAVKAGAVATPLAAVSAVAVNMPENVPLAPVTGAVNVTLTPPTALPYWSRTWACMALA